MKLTTSVEIPKTDRDISYHSNMMFVGSCFASNVGQRFVDAKFSTCVNPFGVLFNPYSVLDSLERVLDRRYFTKDDFFLSDGRYVSLSLHSDHSYTTFEQALSSTNQMIDALYKCLRELTHLFLTFGTAEVFVYNATGVPCANCHRVPQKVFSKSMLPIDQIISQASRIEDKLKAINPNIYIIYTVSPVRYLNEGALGNNLSKAHLFCAIAELVKSDNTYYFPAYEIVMDELRDYRFYAQDMVHPNELAVDFIWERIAEIFFTKDTYKTLKKVEGLVRNAIHRPFNPSGEQYKSFCQVSLSGIEALMGEYPHLDFELEKEHFRSVL